ncbi:MAG TPA: hypothetical protein VN223_11990 [Candidatus Elarobacter sp.]|nr:hypothetical protein [Candidatus Elarobacter sp.]
MAPEIELLNAVASQPYAACESQWKELLRLMKLGVAYIPVIQAAIKEGRWRKQPNPMAYIRKSAMLCAVRLGIVDRRPKQSREVLATDLQYKDADGEPLNHDDRLGTALHNYEQENGPGTSAIYQEDYIGNRIADSVLDENLEVNWERFCRLAGMDAGERIVLTLLRNSITRDSALAACFSEDDRKILQAAWKRFDRNKESLQYVLISGKAAPARRGQQAVPKPDDAHLELIFIEIPGGGLKISFRPEKREKGK